LRDLWKITQFLLFLHFKTINIPPASFEGGEAM